MTDETVTENPAAQAAAPNPETPANAPENVSDAPKAADGTTPPANSETPKENAPAPDWRDLAAGGDAKERARLERFASPADFYKSYRALEQKLSSGDLKKTLAENATPEQLAEWRKENGIPEAPEGYDTNLPDGLVIGENDKPLVDAFLKAMHGANATPNAVKAALAAYYSIQADTQADWVNRSDEIKGQTEETLRTEWGADYKKNLTLALSTLDILGADAKTAILNAQSGEGMLVNDANVLRGLASLAREINPTAGLLPSGGANGMQGIESEIANLQKLMGDKTSDYWKGPMAEKNQARYLQLIEAREKMKTRAA